MEVAFLTLTLLLVMFALLGMYDGFYLHLIRYRLYAHPESRREHWMHTMRGVLFPAILYFLYLQPSKHSFYIGLALIVLDLLAVSVDAYTEKDSRQFMDGLPRWEYIIHLFVNGFHFAAIAVWIIIKVRLTDHGITLLETFPLIASYQQFVWLVENLLPGACLMATIHALLMLPQFAKSWDRVFYRFAAEKAHSVPMGTR